MVLARVLRRVVSGIMGKYRAGQEKFQSEKGRYVCMHPSTFFFFRAEYRGRRLVLISTTRDVYKGSSSSPKVAVPCIGTTGGLEEFLVSRGEQAAGREDGSLSRDFLLPSILVARVRNEEPVARKGDMRMKDTAKAERAPVVPSVKPTTTCRGFSPSLFSVVISTFFLMPILFGQASVVTRGNARMFS